ncbi:hypothetical protein KJB99_10160 [Staphylococcus epidermidis]|nr:MULTISPECIES: hypothetical protein [Staphylococcus]MCD8835062.1 hypothetical protein [Staphylococcus arlettae]MCE5030054.1 hypothetical protein [Staphylococcus epidermidis]MCE5032360.1 hypothetical protein [Staphylococcus epidermidis]
MSTICPECHSDYTVLDKVPGTESLYLFICDSCGHYHDVYFSSKQGDTNE